METAAFKENVKRAAAYLEQAGHTVGHAKLLEAISRAFGERNWSTMRALLESPLKPAAEASASLAEEPWIDANGVMSDREFVRTGGCKCPVCGCDDVESSGVDADGPGASEEVECNGCHARWTGHFTLTGFSGLRLGSVNSDMVEAMATSEAVRQDVVDSLVEDIQERGRKYGFSVVGFGQAHEAVEASKELLGLDATEAECCAAVAKMMGR